MLSEMLLARLKPSRLFSVCVSDLMTPVVHLHRCACVYFCSVLITLHMLSLWGQIVSCFTCKKKISSIIQWSQASPLSPTCLLVCLGTAERKSESEGKREGWKGEGREGWMDGKEKMSPQKHCCLITSLFRSATTVINNPTAGAMETDNTKNGNAEQYHSQLK